MKQQSSRSNNAQPNLGRQAVSTGSSRRHFLALCSWVTAMLVVPVKAIGPGGKDIRVAERGKGSGLNRKIKKWEQGGQAKVGDLFTPGEVVPVSGIYDAIHDTIDGQEHMLPHRVTAIAGKKFPPCRGCHGWVKFRLLSAAEPIETDDNFER